MEIEKKRVLVTGATGGIGAVLCRFLAAEGCQLVFTGIDPTLLKKLHNELGSKHLSVEADINSEDGRVKVIKACQQNGGIDAMINLAGILNFKIFEDQSEAFITATIGINLLSPMMLCHGLIATLKLKKESVIVNVGSTFGSIGHPGFVSYCASKAGMKGFTQALSRELADTSIRVAYIAPRATSTKLNSTNVEALNSALGNKSDSPEYVAGQIVALLKSGKRLKYLGWPEKLFVRVNAIFPGLVHKALVKNLALIKRYASAESEV